MKKSLVIGLGVSGQAAVRYLLSQGKEVIGVDRDPARLDTCPKHPRLLLVLESLFSQFEEVGEVVLSSGIPSHHPLAQIAPCIGEAELSLQNVAQRCVAITGTNGKTSVTLMVEHILNQSGFLARALGNIGTPLSEYLLHPNPQEILVVELSSYQLETLHARVFDAAIILNIGPDHLDRYPDVEAYARAKCRLQWCMKEGRQIFVLEEVERRYKHLLIEGRYERVSSLPISRKKEPSSDCENQMAAWALVNHFGVKEEAFLDALQSFKKPAHRIEFVETVDGVDYFNDSKATNLDAVIHAVNAMKGEVILIAGGSDKGLDYRPWVTAFHKKVKKVLTLGPAGLKIQKELSIAFDVESSFSLKEAVEKAANSARAGDCVLLSPGAASFDSFKNYEQRGEAFKQCVYNLRRKV